MDENLLKIANNVVVKCFELPVKMNSLLFLRDINFKDLEEKQFEMNETYKQWTVIVPAKSDSMSSKL